MYTKGPWETNKAGDIHDQHIIYDNATGQTIAVCYGRGNMEDRETESKANAALIAAAPDMLEACKIISSRLRSEEAKKNFINPYQYGVLSAMLKEVEDAINKAEGVS